MVNSFAAALDQHLEPTNASIFGDVRIYVSLVEIRSGWALTLPERVHL